MRRIQSTKVNWAKWRDLSVIGFCGFVLLFQYQNCAPAPNGVAMAQSEDPMHVDVIDDVNETSGVSFVQEKVQISAADAHLALEGVCDQEQEGALLGWRIRDANAQVLGDGFTMCEAGKFKVEVAGLNSLECDQPYLVTARLGQGAQGNVEIERRCSN